MQAINRLLQKIETTLKSNLIEYEGSDYIFDYIHNVFKDKEIKISLNDERANGQEALVNSAPWYVYNANYGTSEEKKFIDLFSRCYNALSNKYDAIYLIRNEREIKIYDNIGRAFEPDFLLFCKQREGERMTLQIFIESKGQHLLEHDKWKADFLNEIRKKHYIIKTNTETYVITALPFYNYNNEHEFKRLFEVL
ncbi:hypothetical protein [Gracilinema caldarium]|uniref:hypothetical protein n=1 Tax=Gracilinema caldarium TaxID=215591 RepID=UPI0002F03BE7|nr:hypothetical protein [Gracilinema caldarium]